ncbi:Carbohydrate Esterase Family 4 protein [Tuber magnatum]|uniref:Carbohydrate Esterase Family 4 protein n=1 Tax=Tuber magnatum TaxID=42249 RepID=A0A317SSB9_9PEZI|nr:Carbohydrate Esterase Family 4 protein [Tuber magnatum]
MFTNKLLLSLFLSLPFALVSGLPKEPLFARDSPNGRCGAKYNGYSCTSLPGTYLCCSQYNWCGETLGHCGAGCQPNYGICNSSPSSSSTSTTPPTGTPNTASTSTSTPTPTQSSGTRPKIGSVPYGMDIYSCAKKGTIALTYDDGPWIYTNELLDILQRKGVKVTFFVTGNNLDKGAIDAPNSQWRSIIARAYNDGHQIASHTWDHWDLDTLSESDRRFQMTRLEQALVSIIGKYPTYMRPPYIRCESACRTTMDDLGYHVIIWDLNTDDYNNDSPELIENSKRIVRDEIQGTSPADRNFMSIAHDIHEQTVVSLTEYQIDIGLANGYQHVRLGECLNDPEANWYRT